MHVPLTHGFESEQMTGPPSVPTTGFCPELFCSMPVTLTIRLSLPAGENDPSVLPGSSTANSTKSLHWPLLSITNWLYLSQEVSPLEPRIDVGSQSGAV